MRAATADSTTDAEYLEYLRDLEEQAGHCAQFLLHSIDIENGAVVRAHNFEDKIMAVDAILAHLLFSGIDDYPRIHAVLKRVSAEFEALQGIIREEEGHALHLIREEKKLIQQLKRKIKESEREIEHNQYNKHEQWRIAWKHAAKEKKEKNKLASELRADIGLLKKIQARLEAISMLVEKSKHLVIDSSGTPRIAGFLHKNRNIEELEHLISFFDAMYQFARTYSAVFKGMILKEEQLELLQIK